MWRNTSILILGICLSVMVALTACARPAVVKTRIETASVAVSAGCVLDRPDAVDPLNVRIAPDRWAALTVKQKTAHIGDQALARWTYGERLAAATAGCK